MYIASRQRGNGWNHFLFGRISSKIKDNDCGIFGGNLITQSAFCERVERKTTSGDQEKTTFLLPLPP